MFCPAETPKGGVDGSLGLRGSRLLLGSVEAHRQKPVRSANPTPLLPVLK